MKSSADNTCLQYPVQQTNLLMQSELNARMVDLGRERHNTEQLQKNPSTQNESHKALTEILKETQSALVDDLTKEGSVLANVFNSEQSLQAKYSSLLSIVRRNSRS